jgi:uncharacterized protein YhaN
LTREVFCRAFGLNAKSLRDGAEEMLTSKGDVGATLLAAASGLRGLTELRRTLETEADGIFAPRASKDRRFYQATERFEEARRAIATASSRLATGRRSTPASTNSRHAWATSAPGGTRVRSRIPGSPA